MLSEIVTVTLLDYHAFSHCRSLRLLIPPHDIFLSNVGRDIIYDTGIHQIAENWCVEYELNADDIYIPGRRQRLVHEWLIHHRDEAPFRKLFYNSSITTKQFTDFLTELLTGFMPCPL